jgi:Tol biopolymer transport system component
VVFVLAGCLSVLVLAKTASGQMIPEHTPEELAILKQLTGKIVFATNRDGNWEIYSMNGDGSDQKNLTRSPTAELYPRWSWDGKRIVYISNKDNPDYDVLNVYQQEEGQGFIYIMNADGSDQRRITKGTQPCLSPDGKTLAFVRNGVIWLHDMESGKEAQATPRNWRAAVNPAWSPDGKKVLMNAKIVAGWRIATVEFRSGLNVGPARALGSAAGCNPEWTSDGKRIVYIRDDGDPGSSFYLLRSDGEELGRVRLEQIKGWWNYYPDWSPDSRFLIYSKSPAAESKWGYTTKNQNLFVTPLGTGTEIALTAGQAANRDPDWILPKN